MILGYSNENLYIHKHVLHLGIEIGLRSHMCTAIDSDGLVVSTLKLDTSCIRFKRDIRRLFPLNC